ncbi:hypothetical protein CHS0354_014068 [Potamilus streckersoni]|uniref:Uncharacterized protein n=1 Tax=Potamilus streckersoni TaxID=2493646 RepID=A0AAE0VYY4_9BIVA|nr:hypothetical protein CHS0354_014068 [Potamilus streckersoni]
MQSSQYCTSSGIRGNPHSIVHPLEQDAILTVLYILWNKSQSSQYCTSSGTRGNFHSNVHPLEQDAILTVLYILWNKRRSSQCHNPHTKSHSSQHQTLTEQEAILTYCSSSGTRVNPHSIVHPLEQDAILTVLYILWNKSQSSQYCTFSGTRGNPHSIVHPLEQDAILTVLYILWNKRQSSQCHNPHTKRQSSQYQTSS